MVSYLKTTWHAGNMLIVYKHHSSRYGSRGQKNTPKTKLTEEQMAAVNQLEAERKLQRLIAANFSPGDWHLTLTYRAELRPDREQAKANVRRLIRLLRPIYRRMGKELKYIMVIEKEDANIHHHLIINEAGMTIGLIRARWPHGIVKVNNALYEEGCYEALAAYLLKDRRKALKKGCRQYVMRSRNLAVPEPKVEVMPSDHWMEIPRCQNGYWLDKNTVHEGIDRFGYKYQRYILIRPSPELQGDHYIKPRSSEKSRKKLKKNGRKTDGSKKGNRKNGTGRIQPDEETGPGDIRG